MTEAGHNVQLLVPRETLPESWTDLARRYGLRHPFEVRWLPSTRLMKRLDLVWYAHAAARKFMPELIYTWLPQSAALESRLGLPAVLEMHADVAGLMGAWWLRQFWRGRGKRRLLVTTAALRSVLERSAGMAFPDDAVVVAPNGVDLDRYQDLPEAAEARAQLGLPEGFTAGFTGHFYAGRGIDLLLDLARLLPDIKFVWAGGTDDAVVKWQSRLKALRVSNVNLPGFVDNARLPLYQAAADVLLMPYARSISASSGQDIGEVINPMKMFEYMAARRPIITSDLPVIREVLDDSRAVFCPPDDAAAWKAAILDLAAKDKRRQELAANARRTVENYTWLRRARGALQGMGGE